MRHGLGDNAQFSVVLKHIEYYFPNWEIDLFCGKGKASFFSNIKNVKIVNTYPDAKKYDKIMDVLFPTPKICFSNNQSTKPIAFIKKILRVEPIPEFFRRYNIHIKQNDELLINEFLEKNKIDNYIVFHYLGKTLKEKKSLQEKEADDIIKVILKKGYFPLILDWKNKSSLFKKYNIKNYTYKNDLWANNNFAEASLLAQLISKSKLYIGIDSGPLHVAGCTDVKIVGLWKKLHPINFYDLNNNTIHLVSKESKIKGDQKELAINYFEKNYNWELTNNYARCLDTIINNI